MQSPYLPAYHADSFPNENIPHNNQNLSLSHAHGSMFTGRYPTATHVRTNHNTPDMYYKKDMLEVFKEQGYKTALVGKNHAHVKGKDFDYCEEYFHWGKNQRDTQEDNNIGFGCLCQHWNNINHTGNRRD